MKWRFLFIEVRKGNDLLCWWLRDLLCFGLDDEAQFIFILLWVTSFLEMAKFRQANHGVIHQAQFQFAIVAEELGI